MIYAASFWGYLADNRDRLLDLTIEHARIVLQAIVIASLIGVAIGVLTYRTSAPALLPWRSPACS